MLRIGPDPMKGKHDLYSDDGLCNLLLTDKPVFSYVGMKPHIMIERRTQSGRNHYILAKYTPLRRMLFYNSQIAKDLGQKSRHFQNWRARRVLFLKNQEAENLLELRSFYKMHLRDVSDNFDTLTATLPDDVSAVIASYLQDFDEFFERLF